MKTVQLAAKIDHTILKVDATRDEIARLGREALDFGFASVCVHPYWLPFLRGMYPGLRLCTVIGFPLGLQTVKLLEARDAVVNGADELDVVVNHVQIAEADWAGLEHELKAFRGSFPGQTLKLILETCRLTDEQIVRVCQIASSAMFDFVKTSTGFAEHGATLETVRLMKDSVAGETLVKASGGIKDWPTARAMIDAGADRIGTSSGLAIVKAAELFFAANTP